VAKASALHIAQAVQADVRKRDELRAKIAAGGATDAGAQAALLDALKATESQIGARLEAEAGKQRGGLAARLAGRRAKKAALARDESDLKLEQARKRAEQEADAAAEQAALQRAGR